MLRIALVTATLATVSATALGADPARDFPNRPIRIFGQGAGSTADYLSRFVGQRLFEKWGQAIVVDNRAGAGGTLAADAVAKAAPDGYNWIMGHAGPMVSAVSLFPKLPYDPVRDLAPIAMMTSGVTVLVGHPSVPANTAQELIAFARQKGGLSYGSAGNGTISHLTGELFKRVAKVDLQHIPYKSAGFALTALLGNETPISFLSPITAHAQLKQGRVKAFAVSSRNRFPGLPDVPSTTEAGIEGMEARLWFGLFTTAKTPREIIARINRDVGEIMQRPETRAALLNQGAEVAFSTPDELGAFVRAELERWTPIIRASGIKAD